LEQYPSIDKIIRNTHIYAYDKLDGSNIRAEWTRKTGFTKFGSRRQLIDESHTLLGEAIPLFNEKYADVLDEIFRKQKYQKATAFFEFYGENSFAGFHEDEPHEVTLFDVHIYKQGLMSPQEFNKVFKYVDTAPLLFQGKPTTEFVESVQAGTLEDMTFEGVVCKAGYDNRNKLTSFKIKNKAWLTRLKDKCGNDEKMFTALA
jgi:hypothetical protein